MPTKTIIVSKFLDPTITSIYTTRSEIAQHFGITLSTVTNWERRGLIPKSVVVGKKHFWKRSAIQAWLLSLEENGHANCG